MLKIDSRCQFKKSACFSDIHFGRKNNSEQHNNDCLSFVDWFCEQVTKDKSIDHVCFLGDWFEQRNAINVDTLNKAFLAMNKLNDLGLPIFFIVGNHDLYLRHMRTTHSVIFSRKFENFVVIDEPTIIKNVAFLPYLFPTEYVNLHSDINAATVIYGHLEFKGFVLTGDTNVLEHGPDHTEFNKPKKIFTGHFHKRQVKDNVHYIGNTFPMDFSDANDYERGMMIYEYSSDTVNYLNWKQAPSYITTTLSALLKDPSILKAGASVRCLADNDITLNESNTIRETFRTDYDLREFVLEEPSSDDIIKDTNMDLSGLELETTNKIIVSLLERLPDDAKTRKEFLIEIFKSLPSTSQTAGTGQVTPIELLELTIRNFLSYGNNVTKINLDFKKPVLIQGRNLDSTVEGQIDSNGAGKSTILNAIMVALFDKPIGKIKKGELINYINKKNMQLTLTFKKNNQYYKIERYGKFEKHGNDVRLLRKDFLDEPWDYKKHDITNDSIGGVDTAIAKLVGLPFEVFSRIVVIVASHTPFLELELSKQVEIIEELFGFTELSEKAEFLKKIIKANNESFETLTKVNDQIIKERERYDGQLKLANERVEKWNKEHSIKLSELQSKLDAQNDLVKNIDFNTEEKKFSDIGEIDNQILKLNSSLSLEESQLKALQLKLTSASSWNNRHDKELDELAEKINQPLVFKTIEEVTAFEKALKSYDDEVVTLDKELLTLNGQVKVHNSNIVTFDTTIKRHNKSMTDLSNELTQLSDSKCPYCQQQYEAAKTKIAGKTCEHSDLKVLVDDITTKLSSEQNSLKELQQLISTKTADRNKIINDKNSIIKEIVDTEANLTKEYKKTLDLQQLVNQFSVLEQQTNPHLTDTTVDQLQTDIETKTQIITNNKTESKELITVKNEIIISLKFNSLKDIDTAKFSIKTMEADVERVAKEANPHVDALDALINSQPSELKTNELDTLHDTLEHQSFLLKLLTKKDSFIRKALVNRYVPFLNQQIKHYLEKIGLPHKVEFQQDMSVKISQFKAEWSVGNISSGQKARVNIALAFAFRDVLQSRFGNINFCILDECLDTGLGNVGVQLAAKMIKKIAKENNLSMFVISHRDEISSMFDSKITVELKGGFSNIIQSDI